MTLFHIAPPPYVLFIILIFRADVNIRQQENHSGMPVTVLLTIYNISSDNLCHRRAPAIRLHRFLRVPQWQGG